MCAFIFLIRITCHELYLYRVKLARNVRTRILTVQQPFLFRFACISKLPIHAATQRLLYAVHYLYITTESVDFLKPSGNSFKGRVINNSWLNYNLDKKETNFA